MYVMALSDQKGLEKAPEHILCERFLPSPQLALQLINTPENGKEGKGGRIDLLRTQRGSKRKNQGRVKEASAYHDLWAEKNTTIS